MAQEKMLSGCAAAAQGAKFAEVEVICSFPIRPYTAIMMELSKMVANGEIDAEFLHGEGEHAQVSVVLGASACGARAYTGSSRRRRHIRVRGLQPGCGRPLSPADGDSRQDTRPARRLRSEHTKRCPPGTRDGSWAGRQPHRKSSTTPLSTTGWAKTRRSCCPSSYARTATSFPTYPDKVVLPDIAQVREFLPPYAAPHPLSPVCPVSHGPQIRPDQGAPMDAQRAATFFDLPPVIEKAVADYNAIFKRKMDPWLEKYMIDDAEIAFFIQGAHADTCKNAVRHLRAQGLKAGMVRPRWVRPWPTKQIAETLAHVKAVACVETSTSYGGAMRGGNLIHEVRASLYDLDKRPLVTSFMAGLGGDVILLEDFYYMAKILKQTVKDKKVKQHVYWVGFEDEA